MELNIKNIDELINLEKKKELCNGLLFSTFFNKIKLIDFSKVDIFKSSIEIVDKDFKPLDLDFADLNKFVFPKIGFSYLINLVPKNNEAIALEFNLWSNQINGYMGIEHLHFIDDALINNENDLLQLKQNLSLLLDSKIVEEFFYINSSLKKMIYNFYQEEKLIKSFKPKKGYKLLLNKPNKLIKNEYYSWSK